MFRDKIAPDALRIVHSRIATPIIIRTYPRRLRQVAESIEPFLEDVHEVFPRLLAPSVPSFSPYPFKAIQRFNLLAMILPREIVFHIAQNKNVERVFYDRPMYASGFPVVPDEGVFTAPHKITKEITFTTTFWTKKLLGCDEANKKGFFGSDVLVASVDTGASRVHEQIRRVRFKTTMKQFRDENGHGTHVTSTIGGERMTDQYLSGRARANVSCEGMAPMCDLLAIKSLGFYQGIGTTSNIIDAIDIAIKDGADIVNMSLGGVAEAEAVEDDPYFAVFDEMIKNDIIPVVAAGNEGPTEGTIGTPGVMPQALTVGAWDPIEGGIAEFSSHGPTAWGEIKPDVVAPGVNIDSGTVGVMDKAGDGVPSRYSPLSGTSMACPHSSGICALMRESHKKRLGRTLTVGEIKTMLSELVGTKDNEIGWGILDWFKYETWLSTEYGVEI